VVLKIIKFGGFHATSSVSHQILKPLKVMLPHTPAYHPSEQTFVGSASLCPDELAHPFSTNEDFIKNGYKKHYNCVRSEAGGVWERYRGGRGIGSHFINAVPER